MNYSPNNNTSILIKKLKEGQKVKIRGDIRITDKRHNSNSIMHKMAGSGKFYTIRSVKGTRVDIDGYTWAPEDIIQEEFLDDSPVIVNREIALFDPKELI